MKSSVAPDGVTVSFFPRVYEFKDLFTSHMSQKDDLKNFREIGLNMREKSKEITGDIKEFPKYTTQIINIANQNTKGIRPAVVGQMSELIKQCPVKNFKGWKKLDMIQDALGGDPFIPSGRVGE